MLVAYTTYAHLSSSVDVWGNPKDSTFQSGVDEDFVLSKNTSPKKIGALEILKKIWQWTFRIVKN